MTPSEHAAFTATLLARLEGEPDVLGLALLGSSSGLPPCPDAFSDHDFFVVTRDGAQERFRNELNWMPDATRVVLSFRETAHGVKALYASGHLAEFAVFSLEELALARINRYRVALDRADVAARLDAVRDATARATAVPPDARWHMGQLLTQLVAGAGRAARGERLSAHQLVRVAALGHLLVLLRTTLPPAALAHLDDLDACRRFEQVAPEPARVLEAALEQPVTVAARRLLELAARARPELIAPAARAAVEHVLGP